MRALREISFVMRDGIFSKRQSECLVGSGGPCCRFSATPRARGGAPPQTVIVGRERSSRFQRKVRCRTESIVVESRAIERIAAGKLTGCRCLVSDGAHTRTVDLSNFTVLPGLIDLHVHFTTEPDPSGTLDEVTKGTAAWRSRPRAMQRRHYAPGSPPCSTSAPAVALTSSLSRRARCRRRGSPRRAARFRSSSPIRRPATRAPVASKQKSRRRSLRKACAAARTIAGAL